MTRTRHGDPITSSEPRTKNPDLEAALRHPVTIAPRDQRRIALIAKIERRRPSEIVHSALSFYYQLEEYPAIENGYEDPKVSVYAEELCRLIGFTLEDDDGDIVVPAHRRRRGR